MRSLFITAFTLLGIMGWQTVSADAQTTRQLHVTEIELDTNKNISNNQPITNQPIELNGPEQETSFYYELQEDQKRTDQALVLNLSHSELLIAPSSVSVGIDGKTLLSKSLTGEKMTKKLVIPLEDEALKKGFHEVTVSYYGVVKEGICVEQGTTGNWMTIHIDSYFKLERELLEKRSLKNYPDAFTGSEKNPITIILPENASTATLNSGLKVGAFLSKVGNEDKSVRILRESEVRKITNNVLFLGSEDEFISSFMKDLFQQTKFPLTDEATMFSFEILTDGKHEVNALFAIAKSPEELENRVSVLTEPRLIEQLSGEQLVLSTIPTLPVAQDTQIVSLKHFGLSNMTLDSLNRESQQFFYHLPYTLDKEQSPILELHLKHTALAPDKKEEIATEELLEGDIELIAWVNKVPHSINIQQLKEERNGVYTVQLPIDHNTLKDNRTISLQFTTSGLLTKNPCITTDQSRWLYIEEDSFFILPKAEKQKKHSIAEFPFPFVDQGEDILIVLPSSESVDDNELLYLYEKLHVNAHSMNWQLVLADEVSEDSLKKHQLLFIGGPNVQPVLQKQVSELLVSHEKGKPDLASAGFLPETAETVNWIQPSVWSEKKHTMMVWENVDGGASIDRKVIEFLSTTEEFATMVVKSENGKMYTNASTIQLESPSSEVKSDRVEEQLSGVWIGGLVALLIISLSGIIYIIRKRRLNI